MGAEVERRLTKLNCVHVIVVRIRRAVTRSERCRTQRCGRFSVLQRGSGTLRVSVHGTETGMETLVPGDEDETTGGGWDGVQKMSVAAVMIGAIVLVPTLLPSNIRRGCPPADKG